MKYFAIVFILGFVVQSTMAASVLVDDQSVKASDCPRIVSRSEWKARKPKGSEPLVRTPAPYVVVHHGGMKKYCTDQVECSKIVRSFQNFHIDERGWFDIGYSFLVGEDGNVYEGRGWDKVGAHAPGYNSQSIGVCIIGDFSDRLPNETALKALDSLVRCGVALGKLRSDYRVIGHRQGRVTECPGESFYEYVKKMPNWTAHPTPMTPSRNSSASTTTPTTTKNY